MMIQPVLLGGLFIGVLSALPVVSIANCCCLWIIGGGFLAGHLAQQESPTRLTAGRGALVGLLAGLVGALVWLVLSLAIMIVLAPLQERMVATILRNAQDMPPDARQWLEMMTGRSGSPLWYLAGVAFHLFAAVFAAFGGVLAVVFGKRDLPPALGGPVTPPPIPPSA
jgi:hypothetical protein